MEMMNVAKQDILSVLCNRSNEGLCQGKWMAEGCGMPVFFTSTNTLVKHAGF